MTRVLRVLELGSYLAPAYAGMILAEQGHEVHKWTHGVDPVLELEHGERLWSWLNAPKHVVQELHATAVLALERGTVDIVVDNVRASSWERWGMSPAEQAVRLGCTWVSLRADDDGRSFDVIAQARAWGEHGVLPFYLGDTAAGLWLAFKALAAPHGHHVIRQAAALAKLVEGELVVPRPAGRYPYDDPHAYGYDDERREAFVSYRGQTYVEPARDAAWRRANLANLAGRFVV